MRAKISVNKTVRKEKMWMSLKVKKSVTQWSMKSLMKSMTKMKMFVTLSRIKAPSSLLSHAPTTKAKEMCLLPQKGKGTSLLQLSRKKTKARKIWTRVRNKSR